MLPAQAERLIVTNIENTSAFMAYLLKGRIVSYSVMPCWRCQTWVISCVNQARFPIVDVEKSFM